MGGPRSLQAGEPDAEGPRPPGPAPIVRPAKLTCIPPHFSHFYNFPTLLILRKRTVQPVLVSVVTFGTRFSFPMSRRSCRVVRQSGWRSCYQRSGRKHSVLRPRRRLRHPLVSSCLPLLAKRPSSG